MADNQISFEQALERLTILSQKIEKGDIPLDDALNLYKESIELAKICNSKLTAIEQTVKLISENADGSVELVDFNSVNTQRK